MMKVKRIYMLTILAFAVCIANIIHVSAGAINAREMEEKLVQLKKEYPENSKWTESFRSSFECFGFAELCYDAFFGETLYMSEMHCDIDRLCVGDFVRYRPSSSARTNHAIFITNIIGNKVYYVDCNGKGDDRVHWNNVVSKNTLESLLKNKLYDGESGKDRYGREFFTGYIKTQTYNNVVSLDGEVDEDFIITFNEGDVEAIRVKPGETSTLYNYELNDSEYYSFVGWYEDRDFINKFDFSSPVTKSLTLYAKWERKCTPEELIKNQIIMTLDNKNALLFGSECVLESAPIIRNGTSMIPARFIGEILDATVKWDDVNNSVVISKDDTIIKIGIGKEYAEVNGIRVKLDYPTFVENNRVYTPLRFFVERLGANVEWDNILQRIIITIRNNE